MILRKYIPNIVAVILALILVVPVLAFSNNYTHTGDSMLLEEIDSTFHNNIEASTWIFVPKENIGFAMAFKNNGVEHIEIQSLMNNGKITEWQDLHFDEDLDSGSDTLYSQIFFTAETHKIRYKIQTTTPLRGELRWLFKEQKEISLFNNIIQKATAELKLTIVTRNMWGANEGWRYIDPNQPLPETKNYVKTDPEFLKEFANELEIEKTDRYENGNKLIWPISYPKKVSKIIVHHSAGSTPSCEDEEAILRSIYKYHTITRGWGDIGYNYIVGACSGNVYEGRAGDFGAIGAHAGKHNTGSIGVMVMGNFQNNDISQNAIDSLANISRFLGEKFNIDPLGTSSFRGDDLPNIIAHRDVGATTCPGDGIYKYLATIRNQAKNNYTTPTNYYGKNHQIIEEALKDSYSAQPFSGNSNDLFLEENSTTDITLMFKNTGNFLWKEDTFLKIDGDVSGLTFGQGKSPSNIALINEDRVKPNNLGTFDLSINVEPNTSKIHYEFEIIPVINGSQVAYDGAFQYRININKAQGTFLETSIIPKAQATVSNESSGSSQSITSFKDVSTNNEFYGYIEDLKQQGIISSREYFNPYINVSRGEFAKMVSVAAGLSQGNQSIAYKDVDGSGFYEYIINLQSNGITSQSEYFNPGNNISRGESIKMVVNAFGLNGVSDHIYKDLTLSIFKPHAEIAASNNIISKNTLFYPDNLLTREQAAKIISLAKKAQGGEIITATPPTQQQPTYNEFGPRIRTQVGFESDIIKVNGVNSSYSIYSGKNLLASNVSQDIISTVKYENNKYVVFTVNGNFDSSEPFRFVSDDYENGVLKLVNWVRPANIYGGRQDISFRDTIEVRFDGTLYAINELPLEKYLWGLAEQPNGMPQEKNRTIAVLARSYAYYYQLNGGKHPGRHSHLISNGNDQVYRGYDYEIEHDQFKEAVQSTWGEIVFYSGDVIKAPYFSRSDGKTKEAGSRGNNWNFDKFPYTQTVDDPWSCGGTSADIGKNLSCPDQAWGHGVGLSALGAKGMAEEGKDHKEIIQYFYKDVEVIKKY